MKALYKDLKQIDTHDKENRLLYQKLGRNVIAFNGTELKKGKLKLIIKEKMSFWQWFISLWFNLPRGMLRCLLYLKMVPDIQPVHLQSKKLLSLEKNGLNDFISLNSQIVYFAALHILNNYNKKSLWPLVNVGSETLKQMNYHLIQRCIFQWLQLLQQTRQRFIL